MNKAFIAILLIVLVGGIVFIISQQNSTTPSPQTAQPATSEQKTTQTSETNRISGYTGNVLAGTTTPYLAFTKADYDKAKSEGKIIVLNFYANWCPICRAEEPDAKAAFDGLANENVVGFQVNFKDEATDADEKALAQEFEVPYQHTKVILKDGKPVLKETAQWDKQQFVDAITASL